jgi:hypothetical protein
LSVSVNYFGIQGFNFPVLPCGSGAPNDVSRVFYHSPAQIIQRLLVVLGLGVQQSAGSTVSWQVFAVNEPDTPDDTIVVYDTAGVDQGRENLTGFRFEKFGIQLLIRSATHGAGYVKSQYLATSLDQGVYENSVTLTNPDGSGTSTYLIKAVHRTSPVYSIGADTPKSKRRLFTINATVNISRTS